MHQQSNDEAALKRQSARVWPLLGALPIVLVLLTYMYFRLGSRLPLNSDNVAMLLQSYAMKHGNVFLRGWYVAPDSFYTLDLSWYYFADFVVRKSSELTYLVPALSYACVVVCSGVTAYLATDKSLLAVLIVGSVLSVPGPWVAPFVLTGPYHVITILYVLASMVLVSGSLHHPERRLFSLLAGILLGLALVGDPLTLYIGALPLLMAGVANLARNKRPWRTLRWVDGLAPFVALVTGVLFYATVNLALKRAGAFSVVPSGSAPAFADWTELSVNVKLFTESILAIYGADLLGRPLSVHVVPILIRFAMLTATGWAIWQSIHVRSRRSFIVDSLMFAVMIDVAAFIFSNQPVSIFSARYLLPTLIYGTILLATVTVNRLASMHLSRPLAPSVVIACTLLLFGANLASTLPIDKHFPAKRPYASSVSAWLVSHHYNHGFGSYWDSLIITYETMEHVIVAPVLASGSGLAPFKWNSDRRWYLPHGNTRTFLVYDSSNWGNVNYSTAIAQWGQPSRQVHFGNFTVLIWGRHVGFDSFRPTIPPHSH